MSSTEPRRSQQTYCVSEAVASRSAYDNEIEFGAMPTHFSFNRVPIPEQQLPVEVIKPLGELVGERRRKDQ